MKTVICSAMLLTLALSASAAPAFHQLVISSGEPAQLDLSDAGLETGAALKYSLSDYDGDTVLEGSVPVWAGGSAMVNIVLQPGYYDMHLTDLDRTLGVVVVPGAPRERDSYFGIDAALSWLTAPDERMPLLAILRRMGVDTVRERLRWGAVNPGRGEYDWETDSKYDTLRGQYGKMELPILEVMHDAPGWLGRSGKYPRDLVAAAESWRAIAAQWGGAWGAIEMWNEPDIEMFGGNLPADQYVPIQKVAATVFGAAPGFQIGGGIFTQHVTDAYLDGCAANGLLDQVDFISFHTYDHAPSVEALTGKLRGWLVRNGKDSMPLWVTESGRPWIEGEGHPTFEEDADSALDVTMKAIEFRVCGVACYMPFVFPNYLEAGRNFGMLDPRHAPRRPLAAYANLIATLSHRAYIGDLKCGTPEVKRARGFWDGKELVVALYTGAVDPGATVLVPAVPTRVTGIDGRALAVDGEAVPVPDGLSYLYYTPAGVRGHMNPATEAMKLYRLGRGEAPKRPEAPSVILQAALDPAAVLSWPVGYTISEDSTAAFGLAISATNLGEAPASVPLTLTGVGEGQPYVLKDAAPVTLEVAPGAAAAHTFALAVSPDYDGAAWHTVSVAAPGLAPVAVALRPQATLERLLATHPNHAPFPLPTDLAPSMSDGTMELTGDAGVWRLATHFDGAQPDRDHWCFPNIATAGQIDFTRVKGFVFRARLENKAGAHLLLFEDGQKYGFFRGRSFVPADGQWHAVEYLLEDVVNLGTHAKPEGGPDWARTDSIALGVSASAPENVLEVKDFHIIYKD